MRLAIISICFLATTTYGQSDDPSLDQPTPPEPFCADAVILNGLGFSLRIPENIANGTCGNNYPTGSCVRAYSLQYYLNRTNEWLQQKAIDATNYQLQFVNASVYFGKQQGWITNSTVVPADSDNNFWDSISNFFKKFWNSTKAIFQSMVDWVRNLYRKSANSINPCFQALANLTAGAYCTVTAFNNRTSSIVSSGTDLWALPVDIQSTGNALTECLPLIDNYCSLTYGISTTNSSYPFNTTFNWTDGGISKDDCLSIRNQTNCTTNLTYCKSTLSSVLTGIFQTNWIRFVPSASAIENLGTFLAGSAAASTFQPKPQSRNTQDPGISFIPDTSYGENVYANGLNSGQANQTYPKLNSFSITSSLLAVTLLILIR